jgi:exopolysaccharide production protein ExoY
MECTVASDSESLFVDPPVRDVDRSIESTEAPLSDLDTGTDARPANSNKLQFSRNPVIENRASAVNCAYPQRSHADDVESRARGPIGGAAKRAFDVVAALAGVAALLPLFIIVCIAVYVECPGAVLFRQRRIGFDGREFTCLKFRTMALDAERTLREYLANNEDARREWQTTHKLRNDPRITGFGRFLRRSSLDELPQLFNILMGHMSIVGPRPIVAAEVPLYREHFTDYANARPGLTGLWQVSGRNTIGYPQRVAYDVEYLRNWSFIRDMQIILATFTHVWEGNGAY